MLWIWGAFTVLAVGIGWRSFRFFFLPLRWRSPLPAGDDVPTLDERDPEHTMPPHPQGWIPLLHAHELRAGDVRQVRALGRLFAVYRGASGRVAVTDAFCPHLGANLAAPSLGARVDGECLRCPFHGWQFDALDGGGGCARIPYTDKLPGRRATLPVFPSAEADGLVWVWHDAAGGAPTWELPEPSTPGRLDAYWELELAAHPQDITENQADLAHAGVLHARLNRWLTFIVYPNDVAVAPGERLGLDWSRRAEWTGPEIATALGREDWRTVVRAGRPGASREDVRAHVELLRRLEREGPHLRDRFPDGGPRHTAEMTAATVGALGAGGRFVRVFLVIRQVGPCVLKIAMSLRLRGRWRRLPVTVTMAATPTGPCRSTIRVAATSEGAPRWLSKVVLGLFYLLGMQDFRIWGTKAYRARPPFVDGDGRIPAFRKWYSQFYAPTTASLGAPESMRSVTRTADATPLS